MLKRGEKQAVRPIILVRVMAWRFSPVAPGWIRDPDRIMCGVAHRGFHVPLIPLAEEFLLRAALG